MAKKYKEIDTFGGIYTAESTLRKLKSEFEDKLLFMSQGSIVDNVRTRALAINFQVLRNAAQKLSIANMIINTREMQIMPFLHPTKEVGEPGFVISKKGKLDRRLKKKDKKSEAITEMIQQTGFVYDGGREDDFIDFGKMFIRELLTIDQVACELQRNKKGEIGAFWLLDGATISRCTAEGYQGDPKLAYVQEVEGQVTAVYTREDLIFDYMFKRADLVHRGYGFSLLEQAIDLVTTLVLGISYNRDMFLKDKVPKGFLALQGEADRETIEAVERYWMMAMTGIGARFRIPVIPSGKEGVSIDFKTLNPTNRDMEYYKLMLFFLALFAGVFGMDLAELGIKTDTTQQALGENIEGRVKYSKDRGVEALLTFLRGFMNKIIRKIDEDYELTFVGVNPTDEAKKYDVAARAIDSTRTTNEMRVEDGLEELEGEENDMVASSNLNQLRQILQAAQQMPAAGGEGEEGMPQEGEEGGTEENESAAGEEEALFPEEEETASEEEIEKSQEELEKHLEKLLKSGYDVEVEV